MSTPTRSVVGKTEDEVSPLNTFSGIDLVSNDIIRTAFETKSNKKKTIADMLFLPVIEQQNASK